MLRRTCIKSNMWGKKLTFVVISI